MVLVLYVKNVNRAADFWLGLGFEELQRITLDESLSIILSNADFGNVTIQLYDLDFVEKSMPEVVVVNPSLIFSVEDIDEAHALVEKETKKLTPIAAIGEDYSFSFYDHEGLQYAARGPRIDLGLTDEVMGDYFRSLSSAKLIGVRDLDFLPEGALVFFGRVTSRECRDFTAKLTGIKENLYYIDLQNKAISSDLQIVCKKYKITDGPVLLRHSGNGLFQKVAEDEQL
jgi:predicted lactoylglutathione lyase